MFSFREWLTLHERSASDIRAIKPKDGKWVSPYTYEFNVPGDDCGKERCYSVTFSGGTEGVSISFYRDGSVKDFRGGFGLKVFDGVRVAILDFIEKHNPDKLAWSPVRRSTKTGPAKTPEARKEAYDTLSIKAMWPDLYVGINPTEWIRRDLYDTVYVGKGYPPVPDDARKTKQSINSFRSLVKPVAEKEGREIRAREDERQAREDERRSENEPANILRRQELARRAAEDQERNRLRALWARGVEAMLADRDFNPNGVSIGDTVHMDASKMFSSQELRNYVPMSLSMNAMYSKMTVDNMKRSNELKPGKLIGVDDYFNGEMLGKVLAEDTLGNAFPQLKNREGKLLLIIPLRALAKHSEAHDHVQQDLIMRAQMLAQNRENNPDNWQVGDHFVDASGRRITAGGAIKVVGFSTDESGSLHAKMSPSEQHSTSDEGKKWARQNANAVFLMDPKGPLGSLERGRR